MGRIKKNITDEQKRLANSISSNKYYWNNKEKCDAEQRRRDQLKRDKETSFTD